jgi:hypothetical protein
LKLLSIDVFNNGALAEVPLKRSDIAVVSANRVR